MPEPIIRINREDEPSLPFSARGKSFIIHEWMGSGPPYMHVHYADDEAWHVLEGTLNFKFIDRNIEARKGTTVFIPAGVPHTYSADATARYLVILTPRLDALIQELQANDPDQHDLIMKKYLSDIIR